jgi:hypothetical protein
LPAALNNQAMGLRGLALFDSFSQMLASNFRKELELGILCSKVNDVLNR